MEFIVCPRAGVCFGVKRALAMAEECLLRSERPIYSYGPLIHNPRVVRELAGRGLTVAEKLADVDGGVLLLRCHGVSPQDIEEAKSRGLTIIDTTCPNVKKAQDLAAELDREGYAVVVVGEKNHAEVKAITAVIEDRAYVVQNPEEAGELSLPAKIGIISQTTQTEENFMKAVSVLIRKGKDIRILKTICQATEERQKGTLDLAKQVDAMLVLGGKNSANTTQLAKLSGGTGIPTFHIEDPSELEMIDLSPFGTVGITAGASTPQTQIDEVLNRLKGEDAEQTVPPEPERPVEKNDAAVSPEPEEEDMSMEDLLRVSKAHYMPGQKLRALVVHVRPDALYVSLGGKNDLEIPREETGLSPETPLAEIYQIGDEIDVVVKDAKDGEQIRLSMLPLISMKKWEDLQRIFQEGLVLEGKVKQAVKGGLIMEVEGMEAFMPASHATAGRTGDLPDMEGRILPVKIIEINPHKEKMTVSHRAVKEDDRRKEEKKFWDSVREGDIFHGTVERITPFGAFISLASGVDGLLHISEIAWDKIKHPSEKLNVGDEVQVGVKSLDAAGRKISLSMKQLLPDPWAGIGDRYPEGTIVKGKVTGFAPYGAFIQVEDGVEGLVHISELADERVHKPDDVLRLDQGVAVMVLKSEPQQKRLSLSINKARLKEANVLSGGKNAEPIPK
ncbi:MAG: bifunctional 4-hydroxy-3-methylbut-2-enyl diphosphate reductase/30S ribosomal protein S1 [Bacillota bacterium]